ncbi:MAG TPA: YggT family protein [Steroidobacteraceae bacterium]|jgi:YggT family protein|nr:YggT family protein [Steroidobacteraceae bacterium]
MNALLFIVQTLLSLTVFVFLLRLLLQWSRADFRNQIAQAVVRITNPVILPLRRVLPPIGKVDTASVVAVILIAAIEEVILYSLAAGSLTYFGYWPQTLLAGVVIRIVDITLTTYLYAIFIYALLSMVAPGGYSPMQSILASLCEPVLRPFRRIIPPIGGLDLSPLWAGIILVALLKLLP